MANNCYFQAKITGKYHDINELINMMKRKDKYKADGLGRVFDISITDIIPDKDGKISVFVEGDCAWSILTSMIECASKRNLYTETKALNLRFEAFSEEMGIGFQEHFVIDCGNLIKSDVVDVEEYELNELSPEEIDKVCNKYQLTKQELMNREEDGYCKVGGFENWFYISTPTQKNQ